VKRIFVDTDVFVRKLRYPRDPNSEINAHFLERVKEGVVKGATSIFNVLETCGVMSFNLSSESLVGLYSGFAEHFGVKIFFPADHEGNLQYDYVDILKHIRTKQSLGDAHVSYVVEKFASLVSGVVSWNAKDFAGRLPVPVMTPEELLKKVRA